MNFCGTKAKFIVLAGTHKKRFVVYISKNTFFSSEIEEERVEPSRVLTEMKKVGMKSGAKIS